MTKDICRISDDPIDILKLREAFKVDSKCGGYVSFEGIIRDHNHGKKVSYLEYEVYEELASKELLRLAAETKEKFELTQVSAVHRSGKLDIGDVAVMIQVSGGHRSECFLGCKYMIDEIKKRVPIWKHEFYEDGSNDWTRCSH